MDDSLKDKGRKVPGKLAVLLGSGLAILNGTPTLDAKLISLDSTKAVTHELIASSLPKPIPAKLVLKQFRSGYKMIAQHDSHTSHSSHSSHDSHASHDSHSSHDSHTSHNSHTSHTSHISGGFV
jgi:hypothetical protein